MATLVHDDVIDNSLIRRGRPTVKSTWGNRFSIYSGNHMFARSLAIIAGYDRSDIVKVLAEASMKICEGEMIQMAGCFNVNLGLKNYLQRIERKTAVLFSVSCVLGAMLCNLSAERVMVHKKFGYYLGMAYQITDDILDFVADEKTLGKPSGGDIRQGVITLPAIYALATSDHKEELAALLSSPHSCSDQNEAIIDMIIDSGGIDYAYDMAQAFYDRAERQLNKLPDSEAKRVFKETADFILGRNY
jgi:heptaprenyl diphosphate synthase